MNTETNEQNKKTVTVTTPAGREIVVRPLPAAFYMFYGELPTGFTQKAIELLRQGDMAAFAEEVSETMSPELQRQKAVMVREAMKYICVKPRLVTDPTTQDKTIEITPLDLDDDLETPFLQCWAFQNVGGLTEGQQSFRH